MDIDTKIKELNKEKRRIEEQIRALKNETIIANDWEVDLINSKDKWIVRLRTKNVTYQPHIDAIPRFVRIITGSDRAKVIKEIDTVIDDLRSLQAAIKEHDKEVGELKDD